MAQLGGKSVRTLITSLEVLSDDGQHVLMFDTLDGLGGGGVKIRVRRPWESAWASDAPTFTLDKPDGEILSKIVGNLDAHYQRMTLDTITPTDFTGTNPDVANEAEVARRVEERCSQLDIERAKAANIQQEFILDHSRDKHVRGDVPGCPSCEAKVIASVLPESPSTPSDDDVDEDGMPF